MAWIESHQSLGQHPKVFRLASQLAAGPAAIIGHLFYLWWWALDYAKDGDLSKFSAYEVASAARWGRVESDSFLAALKECGWIDSDNKLHDWTHYAGRYLLGLERQKRYRDKKVTPKLRNGDVTSDVTVTPTVHNITVQDITEHNSTGQTKKSVRFQRPSPQEVNDYGKLVGYSGVNGEQFCDFYESKGWVVGRSPMKDWKAAVRLWKKRGGVSFGKTGRGIETGEGRVGYVAGGFISTKKPLF